MFNCTLCDSLSELQMKVQQPLAPGENVNKIGGKDCQGGSLVEIEHLLCAHGRAPVE